MKRRFVLGEGIRQSGALLGFFAEEKNLRLLLIPLRRQHVLLDASQISEREDNYLLYRFGCFS